MSFTSLNTRKNGDQNEFSFMCVLYNMKLTRLHHQNFDKINIL